MADKDFVIKHGLVVGDTATINGVQIDLSGATPNQVLKFDGTKFAPATASDSPASVSYEETIGNNTDTTFTIAHNLETKDLNVIVRENISPYDVVEVAWEATTANIITLNFELAPTTNSKRVVIKGPGTKEFYSTLIGDGSNSTIVINHGLNSKNVVPVIRNAQSLFEVVEVLAQATTLNTITLDFATVPEASSLMASVYLLDVDNSHFSTVGDGTNSEFTITHNLNTRDIGVTCRLTASPYDFVSIRWEATSANVAKVIFSSPPTANSRKIGIYKSLGGKKPFNDEVTLDILDDVSITSASNGQFLSWNGTNWVNASAPGGGGINQLDDISDVSAATPNAGEVLQWNGNAWVSSLVVGPAGDTGPAGPTGPEGPTGSIDALADVVITSATNGQLLQFNGTNWVNSAPAELTITNDLTVGGNLIVSGTTTTLNTETLLIEDNIIVLNSGVSSSPSTNAGIEVERGTSTNVQLRWNETTDKWETTNDGSTFAAISTNGNINLGTDTVGDYVSSLIAGTNITISNNSGESATPTISVSGNVSGVDSISNIDFVQFDTTANATPVAGLLGWDSVQGTLNLGLTASKHIHIGEESLFRVRNSTGATIGKGTAVYASGVEPSGRIQVTPYVADGVIREARFMGLAAESIANGVNGFVQHFGHVRDLDTRGTSSTAISVGDETWAAGDILYVHPTVAGKLTNVAPRHAIIVALIIIRHASAGSLFVRSSSGGHIEDIHDILLTSPTDGQFLRYDSASAAWVNDAINLGTDTIGDYVSSLVAGTGITLSNNSGEGATPTIAVNTSVIQSRVSNVSDEEIGYLDGVTSAIQTQLNTKAPLASPTFTGTVTGTPTAGTTSTGTSGFGYMGLPQNGATTGAYGIVAADAGTHIYSSATRTITIPANATIAMPIGSTIVFIAGSGATVTIAITSDTMYLAGLGTTGSRTLAAFGMATAVKITSTSWIISGNGLT